jgi:glycosyltransferase involved in cell wall biosynthesis
VCQTRPRERRRTLLPIGGEATVNVLQVITSLHKGGAEAHLLLLGRGLQSHGVKCEVAFLRSKVVGGSVDLRRTFEDAGLRTHYLVCERSYDPRSAFHLHRLLRAGTWDVVHSHLPRADAAAAVCRLFSSQQVWLSTVHHTYDNAYSGAPLIPALAPMWWNADGIIAVSEPVRQWCIHRLGIAPDQVRTIVHGIELNRGGRVTPSPSQSANGIRYSIGSIGRYEARKGHETLIRAMVPILKEFPQAELTIAGHDPLGYGTLLKRMIAELDLEPHVHLVGFMSDKDAFFAEIDVFAFASLSEGFGIVLLEAMEAGKPSVVSDISPLTDIICPGVSGLAARREDPQSFANAIMTLFRNPSYLHQMGDEAHRRVVQEFTKERMVEKTLQYYRDVIEKKTAGTATT